MTATNQNIDMYAGDTKQLNVKIYDQDNRGIPMVLVQAKAEWILSHGVDRRIVIKKTTEDGGVQIQDAHSGLVTIGLSTEDTKELATGQYTHRLKIIDKLNRASTVLEGIVKIMR